MARLARFVVVAAVDEERGLGRDNRIPWKCRGDMRWFREVTAGKVVIVGRVTYEGLPPLPGRTIIVVSSQENLEGVTVAHSVEAALAHYPDRPTCVIGGAELYRSCVPYLYLCDKVYLSHIPGTYQCDRFLCSFPGESVEEEKDGFRLETISPGVVHPEQQYLNLLEKTLKAPQRPDRTGVGTRALFGERLEFDLREGFPLLTTKRTWFTGITAELLLFLSGSTDSKILEQQGVNIWKDNTTTAELARLGLPWEEGDMGPMYPHQWRHAGACYQGKGVDYTGQGVDQITELVQGLRSSPTSRRHIVSAWSVPQLKEMVLPPCHCLCQFFVDGEYLDCQLYQRSGDLFLGVPFNIASYALLLTLVAQAVGKTPRRFIHILGDCHLYRNHEAVAQEQLARTPLPFPTVTVQPEATLPDTIELGNVQRDDIVLHNYRSWGKLTAPMAV
jgi:dihydrofolate reductase/thymidylate synthase